MSALTIAFGVTAVSVVEHPRHKNVVLDPGSELSVANFSKSSSRAVDTSARVDDAQSPVVAEGQGSVLPTSQLSHSRILSDHDVVVMMLNDPPIELASADYAGAFAVYRSAVGAGSPAAASDVGATASNEGATDNSNSGSASSNAAKAPVLNTALRSAGQFSGDVLIVGGDRGPQAVSSAQVFDTSDNKLAKTGRMTSARTAMTLAVLDDGTILVAGGSGKSGQPLSSAEIYDPSTGEFSALSSAMTSARSNQTATVITGCGCPAEGEVLIAGGFSEPNNRGAVSSAELYDPTAGTFTATGSMTAARAMQTATAITSGPLTGKVLIAGGQGDSGSALNSAELYDPISGQFSAPSSSMSAGRESQSAVYLDPAIVKGANAGDVLIAGGQDSNGALASTELFDPSSGAFAAGGTMTTPRSLETATLLNSGNVLIAGGENAGQPLASAEVEDPALQIFEPTASMNGVHDAGTAALLYDGRVLIVGGHSAILEYFDPDTAAFSVAGNLGEPLTNAGAALIQ
jgi:hypothetical protein